jgi:3-dehydroquinate dehydratase-1
LLLTLRAHFEAGQKIPSKKQLDDKKRMAHLIPLLPFCQMIDLEIRRWPFTKVMTSLAHRRRVRVIHSYHQFNGKFKTSDAALWAKRSRQIKGDIFKVAMAPRSNEELEAFLKWGQSLKNPSKILIGMGRVGLVSRYLGYSFGSMMTYGHLGSSAAPGQVAADKLGKAVKELYR